MNSQVASDMECVTTLWCHHEYKVHLVRMISADLHNGMLTKYRRNTNNGLHNVYKYICSMFHRLCSQSGPCCVLLLLLLVSFIYSLCIGLSYVVQCHCNVVNFFPNSHKIHPIAHPLGWSVGCILKVQTLICTMPQYAVMYLISCYTGQHCNGAQRYLIGKLCHITIYNTADSWYQRNIMICV